MDGLSIWTFILVVIICFKIQFFMIHAQEFKMFDGAQFYNDNCVFLFCTLESGHLAVKLDLYVLGDDTGRCNLCWLTR